MPAESWADLLANAGDSAQSFEVLDAGDYDVFVTKAETKFSKAGNKMYNLTLEIESGPHAKRKLWKSLVISQSSGGLGMFFRQMAALTLDAKFFATNPDDSAIESALLGKRASAKVIQREKPNGEVGNDVDFLNRPKGPAPAGSGALSVGAGAAGVPGAPPVSAPPVAQAPAVATPAPAPAAPAAPAPSADPWAAATPPTMPGLGQEDPF